MLTFDQVVQHLRAMAIAIAAAGFDAPQPEIAVLDVSSFNQGEATNSSKRQAASA